MWAFTIFVFTIYYILYYIYYICIYYIYYICEHKRLPLLSYERYFFFKFTNQNLKFSLNKLEFWSKKKEKKIFLNTYRYKEMVYSAGKSYFYHHSVVLFFLATKINIWCLMIDKHFVKKNPNEWKKNCFFQIRKWKTKTNLNILLSIKLIDFNTNRKFFEKLFMFVKKFSPIYYW